MAERGLTAPMRGSRGAAQVSKQTIYNHFGFFRRMS